MGDRIDAITVDAARVGLRERQYFIELVVVPGFSNDAGVTVTSGTGIFNVAQQQQQQVSARDYIGKNIGINITYVNSTDDVIAAALKPSP